MTQSKSNRISAGTAHASTCTNAACGHAQMLLTAVLCMLCCANDVSSLFSLLPEQASSMTGQRCGLLDSSFLELLNSHEQMLTQAGDMPAT